MKKASAAIGSTIFFFLAPGIVAGYVPWRMSRWEFQGALWDPAPLRWFGAALLAAGLAGLIECFARFALQGRGTPAPPLPTAALVVGGLYRYVRNPMYVTVLAMLLGQGILFGSTEILEYAAIAWLCAHLFVLLYEEPTLGHRYGPQYDAFRSAVPRWLPRLRPWSQTT
jgi:protein-S-isoprenylcysteine O-methyltransferase Ste14